MSSFVDQLVALNQTRRPPSTVIRPAYDLQRIATVPSWSSDQRSFNHVMEAVSLTKWTWTSTEARESSKQTLNVSNFSNLKNVRVRHQYSCCCLNNVFKFKNIQEHVEIRMNRYDDSHLMSSVLKLTIVLMKLSFIIMPRIIFQSVVFSPSSRQIDSRAILTAPGGLAMDRISTRCCLRIPLTAVRGREHRHVNNVIF